MSSRNTVHPVVQPAAADSHEAAARSSYSSPPPPYDPSSSTAYPPSTAPSFPPPPYHTVVQVQPSAMVIVAGQPKFRRNPVWMDCPHCQCGIQTRVSYKVGGFTWLLVVILFLIGLSLGCCLIPFCLKSCKDAEHSCPVCHSVLGRCKKI